MKKWVILIIIIIIVGVIAFFASRKTPEPRPPLLPTPTEKIRSSLEVLSVFPSQGTVELGETRNAVTIAFDKPITTAWARVVVNPALPVKILIRKDNPNRLIILPDTNWQTDTTYIFQISGVRSLDDSAELKEDIILRYNLIKPAPPVYDGPS